MAKNTSKGAAVSASHDYQRWRLPEVAGQVGGAFARNDHSKVSKIAVDIEAVRNQAYREGFTQGHKEGMEAGETEVRERAKCLERVINSLARPLDDADEQVIEELMMTVMTVARHIIRREIKSDPCQVIDVIQRALEDLPAASRHVKIYLHPEDVVVVREAFGKSGEQKVPWSLIEDALVSQGGCRIQTNTSVVDATVERRITQIAAKLLGGDREEERP